MTDDVTEYEAPTRRDYVKYGGAVVGGGLLAGCTGDSPPPTTAPPYLIVSRRVGTSQSVKSSVILV